MRLLLVLGLFLGGAVPDDEADLLIRGATVYDGTGGEGAVRDLAIKGDRPWPWGSGRGRRRRRSTPRASSPRRASSTSTTTPIRASWPRRRATTTTSPRRAAPR